MSEFGQVLFEHGHTVLDSRPRDAAARRARAVQTVLLGAAYIVAFVFLDWISFWEHPVSTYAWNPNAGASIAVTVIFGRRMIPFLFIGPLFDEFINDLVLRPSPFPLPFELLSSFLIGGVYSSAALFLLNPKQRFDPALRSVRSLFLLTAVTAVSTAVVASSYAALAVEFHVLPADFTPLALSYWVGDAIGILALTPFVLVLRTRRHVLWTVETLLQLGAILVALAVVYNYWTEQNLQPFYILFVPIVWMAVRTGVEGVCIGILVIQLAFILAFRVFPDEVAEMPKIQALMLVLTLTGLFAGVLVTERNRTEAVLRLHQESLARLARLGSIGELAAAVAHEINQPLMAAGTYTRLVDDTIRSGTPDTKVVAETASKAVAQVERAAAVVRRLRALVRLDRSNRVACRVDHIVWETINLCQPDLDRGFVTIHRAVAVDLPPVMVDVLQIEQALLNLLRNSVDAISGRKERMISIEATLAGTDFVDVCVRDSGPGFPPELATNPFLPLSSTKEEGLGIGLPLCRSLIEANGGRIWLDVNSPGAVIHFTLPVVKASVTGRSAQNG